MENWIIEIAQTTGPQWRICAHTKGAKPSFPNFSYGEKNIFLPKGAMAQCPLNTPLQDLEGRERLYQA